MAVTVSPRHAADEEAQAEVEVLNSRLEKTSQLTKKIQASLTRLETSGRSVQEAIGPIYSNTQKLQVLGRSEHIPGGLYNGKLTESQILMASLPQLKRSDNLQISKTMRRASYGQGM